MKKLLLFIISLSFVICSKAQIEFVDDSFNLYSDASNEVGEGLGSKNQFSFNTDWPKSPNGTKQDQVLLRIKYQGLSPDIIEGIQANAFPLMPYQVLTKKYEGLLETWVFLPLACKNLTLTHPIYGEARLSLPATMKNQDVYIVQVIAKDLVNVDVEILSDYGLPLNVTLNKETKSTPARFSNVTTGKHKLEFAVDGKIVEVPILVSSVSTHFSPENTPQLDFRHFKNIKINSTVPGARIYVDGSYVGDLASISQNLSYGQHNIIAKIDENNKDEKNIKIDDTSEEYIFISPIEQKTFEVIGLYNGRNVNTSMSVYGSGRNEYSQASEISHKYTLPVGSEYDFEANYMGHRAKKHIKVEHSMANDQIINIHGSHKIVWPWEYKHTQSFCGFSVGYVQKQLLTTLYTEDDPDYLLQYKEIGFWDDGNWGWLRGFQLGFHAQGALPIGLGLYSGLFWEMYLSKNDEGMSGYHKYQEHDLYIPIHGLYRLPFGRYCSLDFQCGIGFSFVLDGFYYSNPYAKDTEYEHLREFWGDPYFPKKFNLTLDFGLSVRLGALRLNAQFCKGLNDHKSFREAYDAIVKTTQNKVVLSLSILIPNNDE